MKKLLLLIFIPVLLSAQERYIPKLDNDTTYSSSGNWVLKDSAVILGNVTLDDLTASGTVDTDTLENSGDIYILPGLGDVYFGGNAAPLATNSYDLGASDLRYDSLYVGHIGASGTGSFTGNVGIGTTPHASRELDVVENGAAELYVRTTSSTGDGSIWVGSNGSPYLGIVTNGTAKAGTRYGLTQAGLSWIEAQSTTNGLAIATTGSKNMYFVTGNTAVRAYFQGTPGHFVPYVTGTYNLGTGGLEWDSLLVGDIVASGDLTASGTVTGDSVYSTKAIYINSTNASLFSGQVTVKQLNVSPPSGDAYLYLTTPTTNWLTYSTTPTGSYIIRDVTRSIGRVTIDTSGLITLTGKLTVADYAKVGGGNQDSLIYFDMERDWVFHGSGSGGSTALVLSDLTGGKGFQIRDNVAGVTIASFYGGAAPIINGVNMSLSGDLTASGTVSGDSVYTDKLFAETYIQVDGYLRAVGSAPSLQLASSGNVALYLSRGATTNSGNILWQDSEVNRWIIGQPANGPNDLRIYSYGVVNPVAWIDYTTGSLTLGATDSVGTGSLFAGSLTASGSIDGTSQIADTSAFTTTGTRKAIYIAGALSTDVYTVSHRNATGSDTLPVADDQLSYYAKADSLIVLRQAGTTSGQKFSYIRIK